MSKFEIIQYDGRQYLRVNNAAYGSGSNWSMDYLISPDEVEALYRSILSPVPSSGSSPTTNTQEPRTRNSSDSQNGTGDS